MSIKMQINCLFLLMSIFYCTTVLAGVFPNGCQVTTDFAWSGPELLLNENGKQAFYLMRNRSSSKVELQRTETREVFMSPPLVAGIKPGYSAAFASDVANLRFKCFRQNDAGAEPVSCSEVLDVCHYPYARFAVSNMGTYWVSSDKPEQSIIRDAVAKGIYLRWKK